jgi:hypothetical protein
MLSASSNLATLGIQPSTEADQSLHDRWRIGGQQRYGIHPLIARSSVGLL